MSYFITTGELNHWQKQLKAFLDENNIDSSISNMKEIQEAVYKADLGYLFGEYPFGMFSQELRNDIERLNGVR